MASKSDLQYLAPAASSQARPAPGAGAGGPTSRAAFPDAVAALFAEHFPRIYRVLHRLCGEPDLAADAAQEAFVRLYERGSLPDEPVSWLVTVALNQFRNSANRRARRIRLLTAERAARVLADPPPSPAQVTVDAAVGARVRAALDHLPERDRRILLLCADGFRYREIATALGIREASVGTLLARAKRAFRAAYGDDDAS